jgi:hypothetical protein
VHVHAYKLKLEPALWHVPELTPELLSEHLPDDALIQALAPYQSGAQVVTVGLQGDRESHEEALDELLFAAQKIGYAFAEAEITKIADRAVEMAVGGGIGGFGVGSTTENGELAVLGAFAGWIVGLFVGANMKKVEVLYRVQLTNAGWQLTRVTPQPAPLRPALQAG